MFGTLESSFADLLVRLYPGGSRSDLSFFRLLAATLLLESRRGHIVCHLPLLAGSPVPPGLPDVPERYPSPEDFVASLSRIRKGEGPFPIVFDSVGKRAWLLRARETEERIAGNLRARAGSICRDPLPEETLDRLFGLDAPENLMRRCAETVFRRRLLILSGGPGTGKTTALSRILAGIPSLLGILPERIALCAPTGKAASRLGEALSLLSSDPGLLASEREFLAKIPPSTTLHRLLGQAVPREEGTGTVIPVDLLVIDEMSMVDLSLFDNVLGDLSEDSRLILSGDRDQLSSVAPGSVFGELLKGAEGVSPEETGQDIARSVTILVRSHRFGENSGIGRLSRWIRSGGDGPLDWETLPGVFFRPLPSIREYLDEMAREFLDYTSESTLSGAFRALSGVGVLSPLRQGPRGVVEISKQLAKRLFPSPPGRRPFGRFPAGGPLVIKKNDIDQGLSNGDVGIIPFPRWGDSSRAVFLRGNGKIHSVPIALLPPWESALALTVHKSQGNEFSRVHLLLPETVHPLLTRELLYTAVTRARERLTVWGDLSVFLSGVRTREERHSALGDFLWFPSSIS